MQDTTRTVRTARLRLIPWNLELIDAFMSGDGERAASALEIVFPEPFAPAPETGDVLEFFRRAVAEDDADGAFLPRMIVRDADAMAVGSIGLGAPDEQGVSVTGYSVYPQFEGLGTSVAVEWTVEGRRGRVAGTVVELPFLDLDRKRA